jgi:hypothetical protein
LSVYELELKECNIIDNIVKSIDIILDCLNDQNIRKKVDYIKDKMLNLNKICLIHIHTINANLKGNNKSKGAKEISMKLAEDFTIKVLRALYSYNEEIKGKIIQFEKNKENLNIFELNC